MLTVAEDKKDEEDWLLLAYFIYGRWISNYKNNFDNRQIDLTWWRSSVCECCDEPDLADRGDSNLLSLNR